MPTRMERDVIAVELVKNALASIADEMAVTMVHTAGSCVMKQAMNFSTAICIADGHMVAHELLPAAVCGAYLRRHGGPHCLL